jgi:hypothetical protein
VLDGVAGTIRLSPGGKYFAASREGAVELYEAESGVVRGRLPAGGAVSLLTFTHDGRRLAGVQAGPGDGTTLVAWDLAGGREVARFPVTAPVRALQWAGAGHLLRDPAELLDLAWQGPIWRYDRGRTWRHAVDSPDGRHWFVEETGNRPGEEATFLTARALPDAEAAALAAKLPPGAPARLRPGETVALRIELGDVPAAHELGDRLRYALAERLRAAGHKAGPGGRATAVARAQGENLVVELTDDGGAVLWSTTLPPVRVKGALPTDPAGRWRLLVEHVLDVDLPSQVVSTPHGLLPLPGRSRLAGDPAAPGR